MALYEDLERFQERAVITYYFTTIEALLSCAPHILLSTSAISAEMAYTTTVVTEKGIKVSMLIGL